MVTPFIPKILPIPNFNWEKLSILIGKANSSLSVYNGLLEAMINPNILLSPLTTQEAVLSSKIEGTQASLTDVLKFDAGEKHSQDRQNDIMEIVNYRQAMISAQSMLEERPFIHLNMLKNLHFILLDNVRGSNKARGEFRVIQNYIGQYGTTIENATFVPPAPSDIMPLLSNWENYINKDSQETLVQLGVLHAQFEMIHPFLDGNGRIGRMLIPIYLYQKNLLKNPVFYLSEYFESNKEIYYTKLKRISANDDWQGWIEFFLNAIIEQASKNTTKAKSILKLYEKSKTDFAQATHSHFSIKILDTFFISPIINSRKFLELTNIKHRSTGITILKKLEKAGLIKTLTQGRGRASTSYVFPSLINLTEEKEVI